MNAITIRAARFAAGTALLFALAGCVGYVEGDGTGVVVAGPDEYWFGGYYGPGPYYHYYGAGPDYHYYGRRGYQSRHESRPASSPAPAQPGPVTVVPASRPAAASPAPAPRVQAVTRPKDHR